MFSERRRTPFSGQDENLDIYNPCSNRKYVQCPGFSLNPSLKYHIIAVQSRQQSSYIGRGVWPKLSGVFRFCLCMQVLPVRALSR